MPFFIIKLPHPVTEIDHYLMWSTISDGPYSKPFPREEFVKIFPEIDPDKRPDVLPQRMERVDKTGCSALHETGYTLENLLDNNRMGPKTGRILVKNVIKNIFKS